MEPEDESTAYLKFFSDGPLLNSNEENLNDGFPVESIFTEIESDWPGEGLPILLSGSLVTDDNGDSESTSTNPPLFETLTEDSNSENAVTYFSNIDKNGLILSNDVLLKVREQEQNNTVTHIINGDTYSVTYSQEDVPIEEEPVGVIQLLNVDGTITNFNKNALRIEEANKNDIQDHYTQIQAYKCNICSFICETVAEISVHINIRHEENREHNVAKEPENIFPNTRMTSILNADRNRKNYTMYLCSDCGNAFPKKEELKQHMVEQHKLVEAVIAPEKTDKTSSEGSSEPNAGARSLMHSNLLKKQQQSMKKHRCSIKGCPMRFAKDEIRQQHEQCHVNQEKNKFMCYVCNQKFSLWRLCIMHMWKSHTIDMGLLTCPICNQFKALSFVRVLNHMAIHSQEKPFKCGECDKTFKQLNQLRNHEVIHKNPNEVAKCYSSQMCKICDRLFANSKTLKKHIKFVHDKFRPFICNICGHQTSRKEMLVTHQRQHTGDKPYSCNYCDFKTADRNCLRKHKMRHFGVMKYMCPYCSYQSIQTSCYKVHLATKHPGKEGSYTCNLCRYTSINYQAYLSHVKYHELDKEAKSNGKSDKSGDCSVAEEDETSFLNTEHSEDAVDTGGITIPAGFCLQLADEDDLMNTS